MTSSGQAEQIVQQRFSPEAESTGFPLQLNPADKIVNDTTRVPKELRRTLSVVADSRWDLTPLVHKKTLAKLSINFDKYPSDYRDTAKRLIWSYINIATPVGDLERATATRTHLSPNSICMAAWLLRNWMDWLATRGILQFADVTDTDFLDYCDELSISGIDRSSVAYRLFAITRAWLYAPYLPAEDRLMRPTWERTPGKRDEVLGAANWSSENKTIPVHPQTMSALLIWAMRFIENFSSDIIAAKLMKSTPREVDPEIAALTPMDRFHRYLNQRRDTTGTVPGTKLSNKPHVRCFAKSFMAWELGIADPQKISLGDLTQGLEPTAEATLPLTITGTFDGQTKWTEGIDFYEVEELSRHLATASFIVVAYLTGMRGEECRALERGCCQPTTNATGEPAPYIIRGKTFKGALDKSGNAIPAGIDRDHPWFAIAPVAKAIAVMEVLHPDSHLLFPIEAFNALPNKSSHKGIAVTPPMTRQRIADFIDWCNETSLRLERADDTIYPDPDGRVVVKRFRRTLAWFIYRKPGGRIALGVQYGHLRGHTTDGYGSRVAVGLRDVFPMEEALARADYLEDAYTNMEDGEQVSGPAAGRYREALMLYGQEFRGRYMSGRQAAALRANPRLRIYDNSARFVTCCYDQSKALCHPDRLGPKGTDETPDINHCQPNCGNIARTDRNIERAAAAIKQYEAEIASPLTPEPLRTRLAQRITALQALIVTHTERTSDGSSN